MGLTIDKISTFITYWLSVLLAFLVRKRRKNWRYWWEASAPFSLRW